MKAAAHEITFLGDLAGWLAVVQSPPHEPATPYYRKYIVGMKLWHSNKKIYTTRRTNEQTNDNTKGIC